MGFFDSVYNFFCVISKSPESISSIIGNIIGSLLGALITGGIAIWVFKSSTERENQKEIQRNNKRIKQNIDIYTWQLNNIKQYIQNQNKLFTDCVKNSENLISNKIIH